MNYSTQSQAPNGSHHRLGHGHSGVDFGHMHIRMSNQPAGQEDHNNH